jgi:hypothetical protein
MATKDQENLRFTRKLYRVQRLSEEINRLRSDFRAVAKDAKLEAERLGPMPGDLPFMTIPADYRRILDGLGTCTPKTRRLASSTLKIFDRMDSRLFLRILKDAFFDTEGKLKPEDFHGLFLSFHSSLLEEIRTMRRESRYRIPLYKANLGKDS